MSEPDENPGRFEADYTVDRSGGRTPPPPHTPPGGGLSGITPAGDPGPDEAAADDDDLDPDLDLPPLPELPVPQSRADDGNNPGRPDGPDGPGDPDGQGDPGSPDSIQVPPGVPDLEALLRLSQGITPDTDEAIEALAALHGRWYKAWVETGIFTEYQAFELVRILVAGATGSLRSLS